MTGGKTLATLVPASKLIANVKEHVGDGYVYGSIGQTCTIALLKAKQSQYGSAMGNGYYQKNGDYTKGLCAKWLNKWVCDCSGLIKNARKELSNTWRDVSAQGTYDQCETADRGKVSTMKLIPGVAVFMYSSTKKRMTHVGVYIGNGYVVEARGVLYGVVKTKLSERKWTHWGKLGWVKYDLAADSGKPVTGTQADDGDNSADTSKDDDLPVLKKGSKGSKVKMAQKLLLKWNSKCLPKYGPDGEFGKETVAAVKKFQTAKKLKADGVVGEKSWQALLDYED